MEQQTFAAIEEAQAEKISPHKRKLGNHEHVADKCRPRAADLACSDEQRAAERAVTVHMLDVGFERRIGVMDQVVIERGCMAVERDGLVNGPVLELRSGRKVRGGSAKESQLRIGIESAMLDPAPEKKIAPLDVVGVGGRVGGQQILDLLLQLGAQLLIRVEREDPCARAFCDGGVL